MSRRPRFVGRNSRAIRCSFLLRGYKIHLYYTMGEKLASAYIRRRRRRSSKVSLFRRILRSLRKDDWSEMNFDIYRITRIAIIEYSSRIIPNLTTIILE